MAIREYRLGYVIYIYEEKSGGYMAHVKDSDGTPSDVDMPPNYSDLDRLSDLLCRVVVIAEDENRNEGIIRLADPKQEENFLATAVPNFIHIE